MGLLEVEAEVRARRGGAAGAADEEPVGEARVEAAEAALVLSRQRAAP